MVDEKQPTGTQNIDIVPTTQRTVLPPSPSVIENPWRTLRQFTPARIGLGRAGHSLPTREHLDFQLAHAKARDAVYQPFDAIGLCDRLTADGLTAIEVASAAPDRAMFLRRPDMGRRLSAQSRALLTAHAATLPHTTEYAYDLLFVLGDGLSAEAIHLHALPVLYRTIAVLKQENWYIAPVIVARESRVALGDDIAGILRAEQVAILIGERPGLSAPESLGIYLTYDPHVGRLESDRNCISNIRPEGLTYNDAADTLVYFLRQARQRKMSGVELKDERDRVD